MIRVWGMSSSGNCHKVRLILDYLKKEYEWIETDTRERATQSDDFKKMNANARVPLVQLEDGTYLPESNAILYYFAQGSDFWPQDKLSQARVLQWMFFEQYDHEPRIAVNRAIQTIFKSLNSRQAEYDANLPKGQKALAVMENHLASNKWFGAPEASIADIALYAYTHVAEDGGFDLNYYPQIRRWLTDVEKTPSHSRMTAR